MASDFISRISEAQRSKQSIVVLGVDPQLDHAVSLTVPNGQTLVRFCCEIVDACAPHIVAIKPQLAFFEARGLDGLRALREVIILARRLGLLTIADAKRGDIGSTSAAYAEAFLGDGDFGCDAVTVNPYLGSDAIKPFLSRVQAGRGIFVLVKTSNPSSGEFQDLVFSDGDALWQKIARRVNRWGKDFIGQDDLSPVGAVIGATYPAHARRARELMPNALILVPGYGAQGASAEDSVGAAREDGTGILVNASRSLMYAFSKHPGSQPGAAAAEAAHSMRTHLNEALRKKREAV